MSKFEQLTKYIDVLDEDNFGTWIIDCENDGTPEHPIQMPFVNCTEMAHRFIDDVYDFSDNNKDYVKVPIHSKAAENIFLLVEDENGFKRAAPVRTLV